MIHPKLARGIKKIELMNILGSDPDKIHKEGEKFSCENCDYYIKYHPYNPACAALDNPKYIAFEFKGHPYISDPESLYDFIIYFCWTPK